MRLCQLFKIPYPILAGPMHSITMAPFVIAVSKAGGLGCLATAGIKDRILFNDQINEIRGQTNAPFAVNIAWTVPGSEKVLEWCLENNIAIVISSAGMPRDGLEKIKKSGAKIMQMVGNVAQAKKAEAIGVDVVIAKGWESGGMNAGNAVSSLALIPQVVDAVSIPVVAAGGIADGRGLAAAFALGAEGILMGTRFLATQECPIHDSLKEFLISTSDIGTYSHDFSSFSVRFLRSKRVESLKPDAEIWSIVPSMKEKYETEDIVLGAGQISGLIKEIVPVTEVIQEMIRQYKDVAAKLSLYSFTER